MSTAIILTGGKSRRFGQDKALIEIDGVPIVKRIHQRLLNIFSRVFIVGGNPGSFRSMDLEFFSDRIKGVGALGGIYTGLIETPDPWLLAVACDMPFLSNRVIDILIENIGNEDILCPKINGFRQPLHALYHKSCIEKIEVLKERKDLSLPLLFENADVRFLAEESFADIDNYELSFMDFNTPEDLKKLL
jgi:molybdopterin-guanine dinucleotide biosynthesis protein A